MIIIMVIITIIANKIISINLIIPSLPKESSIGSPPSTSLSDLKFGRKCGGPGKGKGRPWNWKYLNNYDDHNHAGDAMITMVMIIMLVMMVLVMMMVVMMVVVMVVVMMMVVMMTTTMMLRAMMVI